MNRRLPKGNFRKIVSNVFINDRARKLISNRAKIGIAIMILLGIEKNDGVCGLSEMADILVTLRNWERRIESVIISLNDKKEQ